MLDAKSDEVTLMLGYMPVEELIIPIIKYVQISFILFCIACAVILSLSSSGVKNRRIDVR